MRHRRFGTDDLAAIATLGFRGEALASIASVAKVELTTSTEDSNAATRVIIEGGRMRDVKDAAHPRGTTIAIRDFFFNVPAVGSLRSKPLKLSPD
jgi:DNA mismatch repair protein MutL